jgi:hypothetical protein
LHSYHFYVEEGLPQTQVLLWVTGESPRAAFENVIVAEYRCRYEWQNRQVKDIHGGVFYPTRFASRDPDSVNAAGIFGGVSPEIS